MNPYQNYNPTFYNPQFQPPRNNRIWVQGEAGAKSYLVAPNSSVDMWDSEAQTIYVKSTDATGMPTMQVLDYTIRGGKPEKEPVEASETKYASIDDLNELRAEIGQIKEQLNKPTAKKGAKTDE